MKNPLQSLLIFFALSLCGLCAWQWYAQVQQHDAMTKNAQTLVDQAQAIQGYTNSMAKMDEQIAQMDRRITEFRDSAKSNAVLMAGLRQESGSQSNLVAQYKIANETMQDQVKLGNDAIRRQNDVIKEIAAQRDEFVKQLNAAIKERNDVVTQYNELLQRFHDLQAGKTNKTSQSNK